MVPVQEHRPRGRATPCANATFVWP
jgi:hypothetical protein